MELGWEALAAYADELGDGELWIGHAEQPSTRAPERRLGGLVGERWVGSGAL